jgi:hypothetical protein
MESDILGRPYTFSCVTHSHLVDDRVEPPKSGSLLQTAALKLTVSAGCLLNLAAKTMYCMKMYQNKIQIRKREPCGASAWTY